ncbi:MAG TPA: YidB family protein [Terriglobales bacterium]|nr:YidB family protein [Terriglobales bacterium]
MGLFDQLQNQMTGATAGANVNHANGIMELIQNYPGGISGLIQQFHNNGLSGIVSSWIGTGQNLPVSGDQIQSALGSEFVQNFAGKMGISPENASSTISQLLPSIMDKLTPNGQVPEHSDLMSMGSNLLKSFGQS